MLGTLGSGNTFLTEYYMLLKKKVILTATTRCAASRFSSKASTIHITFLYNANDMFGHYKN